MMLEMSAVSVLFTSGVPLMAGLPVAGLFATTTSNTPDRP